MDLLYIAFPAALLLGALFLALFLWASKRGQYDDLDTPSIRMLHDDEPISAISGSDVDRKERSDVGFPAEVDEDTDEDTDEDGDA